MKYSAETRRDPDDSPRLLKLPLELRDIIYSFVVADLPSRISISSHAPISQLVLLPNSLPGICFASKQLRAEAILVYLQRTRLVLDDLYSLNVASAIESLDAFLDQFHGSYECIRMLTFCKVQRFGDTRFPDEIYAANFVSRCSGLQDLLIDFRLSYLLRFCYVDEQAFMDDKPLVRLLTKATIKVRWGLRVLFSMNKLTSAKFRCTVPRWLWEDPDLGDPEEMVRNLREVLEEGFERRKVSLTWSLEILLRLQD